MIKFQAPKAIAIPLSEERGFGLDLDLLEAVLAAPATMIVAIFIIAAISRQAFPPADIGRG